MKNKTVLVTGASRGIGKAIALKFAQEGYDVIINSSKSFNDLLNTAEEIREYNVNCMPVMADVSNYTSVKNMFEEISLLFNHIDIVINNAGVSSVGLFTDLTEDTWDYVINSNLKSVYNICHFSVPNMIRNKSGKIINISSIWGITGASCEVAYSASKGGINAFSKALAKELGPSNISVNAIACGVINTSMNTWLNEEETEELISEIPMNRIGRAEEVANLAYYLASDQSSYINGQVITLDGGMI